MKHIILSFFVFVSTFMSTSAFPIWNNTLKMGDTKVYTDGNEIIVENFHNPAIGIAGLGRESWGEFSWDKLDKYIYKQVGKNDYAYLWIVIKYVSEDRYGNKTLAAPITIGKIDVYESRKYISYEKWHLYHKAYNMWAKDRNEYNREIDRMTRNANRYSCIVVPAYKPKSIR